MKAQRRQRRLMVLLMAAMLGISSLMVGCGDNGFQLISREQEIAMGEEAAPKFKEEFGGEVEDEALQQYVRGVGQSVAAKADRPMPYEFTLVRSDTPNAFALPGGKIFITAGLMSYMENERELAAVLAHEVAHVVHRHNVDRLKQQMGASVLLEVAKIAIGPEHAETAGAVGNLVANMTLLKYSRDDEYEADRRGVSIMERAGYNPWGMVELLETLKALSGEGGGTFNEMFQTHPLPENRIDKARELVRDDYESYSAQSADPDAGRFRDMQQRLLDHMGWKR
ncbi:MAG: M48 family metalloprotease [Phycisphaerae bacterium]